MRVYLVSIGRSSVAVEPHDPEPDLTVPGPVAPWREELSLRIGSNAELTDSQVAGFLCEQGWDPGRVRIVVAGWDGDRVHMLCTAVSAADFIGSA